MPSFPRSCPDCGARLDTGRSRGGSVRCPECDRLISAREDDEDARRGVQTRPGTVRVAPSRRSRDDEDEPVIRKKPGGSTIPMGCIVASVAALVLGVLGLGGIGVAVWIAYAESENPEQPVAAVSVPPVQNAPPADNGAPWPVRQPVKNAPPLPAEPPRDPIKPAAVPGQGAEAAVLPLQELKAATVYIKNETPGVGSATGSGFAIRSQGDNVLIVTNHHVIAPLTADELGGRRSPFGRPPMRRTNSRNQLSVVFRSGTPQQQECPAVLVADNSKVDLAVLRVVGVREAPSPIDISTEPKLIETKPVLALGFPFGSMLDPNKGNPAITVTRGAVTSLRMRQGELAEVQVDCDLNPGNSGGPVVDDKGALVGVAVAKVDGTKLGFAVPVHEVNRLLGGQIDSPSTIRTMSVGGHPPQVQIVTRISDPLGSIRSPALLYAVGNDARVPARLGNNEWQPLVGARTSVLLIEGTLATAVLDVQPPQNGDMRIVAQVSYQDANGRTVYGEPRELRLGSAAPAPAQPAPPPNVGIPGQPVSTDLDKLVADLKSPDESARQAAAEALYIARQKPSKRIEVRQGLLPLLDSADVRTRLAAVRAFAVWDQKEAAPVLAKHLQDPEPQVRLGVLTALQGLKDPRVAEAVAAALPTNEEHQAHEALIAMGPGAEKAVLPYLTSANNRARHSALDILRRIGGAESEPVLNQLAAANPDDGLVRDVLKSIQDRVPVKPAEWPKVLESLRSANAGERTSALRRISVTPPVEQRRAALVPQLELLLNDAAPDARTAAMRAFVLWGGKSSIPAIAKRLEGFDPGMHAQAIDALAELKDETAAAAIAPRLADLFDRKSAANALLAIGTVAEKAVLPMLDAPDPEVRSEACKILAEIGGRDSISALEPLTQANNVFFTPASREAVETIRQRLAMPEKK